MLNCKIALAKLENLNNSITIKWIPGHEGHDGNEFADKLAKNAANIVMVGPEPILPIPYSQVRRAYRQWFRTEHIKKWTNRNNCRVAGLFINPITFPADSALKLPRNTLRKLVGYLTGHCAVQQHLHRIGKANSSMCPKCEEEPESIIHHITKCPYYYRHRIKCWGTNSVTPDMIKQNDSLSQLIHFINSADRFGT